jgi:hypothetical protein
LEKHKPWFDDGCFKLLDHSNQANLQWLQDPRQINGDNLNNIRHEASIYFRNKRGNICKTKLMGLATNSKNKNIRVLYREINEFKRD